MKEQSNTSAKARIRRLKKRYRRYMLIVGIVCFILGILAGVFGYRWVTDRDSDVAVTELNPTPTPSLWGEAEPTEEAAPVREPEADSAEQAEVKAGATPSAKSGDEEAGEAETGDAPETTPVPDLSSDEVPEYDPAQAEVPEEYQDGYLPEGDADEQALETADAQAGDEIGEEVEAEPTEAPAEPREPQVIAIVPYGESYTYSTQITSDGYARVQADDADYETLSFTQTMQDYMRPTDFADKYATQYKLQGNEAGASFELILNDYTGEATIIPQNVVDISFQSESGGATERGFQLMDAEIAGSYDVELKTNTPKVLYKRFAYTTGGEDMKYLVVTTYNDGQPDMILFELESDQPAPTPEIIYMTLQKGVKTDDVKVMQEQLIEQGYLVGAADGDFGNKTEAAVKAAQEAFGLEQNGIADNGFLHKLYENMETQPTPVPEISDEEAAAAEATEQPAT